MSQPHVNSYIGNLQRQIADVASRIKQKQSAKDNASSRMVVSYEVTVRPDVEAQPYKLIGNDVAYNMLGQAAEIDCSYATGAYGVASRINRPSSVVEGLVFKNNKQFDFKV